jgi:hypothetical protein
MSILLLWKFRCYKHPDGDFRLGLYIGAVDMVPWLPFS